MTTTDLSTIGPRDQALARLQDRAELIRQTVAPDATDQELALFFEQCVRLGLDPIIRQAYLIKRKGRATLQVGIDGLRSIADRTGNYVGSDDPIYVDNDDGRPFSATVTVWKFLHNQRCPFTATARFDEYTANTEIWSQKPHVMIAKVAEALALRKAFPSQMESAYVTEELDQLDHEPAAARVASQQPRPAPQPARQPTRQARSTPAPPPSTRSEIDQREVDAVLDGFEREFEDAATAEDVKRIHAELPAVWERLTGAEQQAIKRWEDAAVARVLEAGKAVEPEPATA